MDSQLYDQFCKIAYDKAGIHIKSGKEALVTARVAKRQRALGIQSPYEYLQYLTKDKSGDELIQFLDAISTNFTRFFREKDHFDILKSVIDGWVSEGKTRFRLWSSASSSGEEPYSMAMALSELADNKNFSYKILATDISTKVLQLASEGIYSASSLEAVPVHLKTRFFEPFTDTPKTTGQFVVKPAIRDMVIFRRLNLAVTPFPVNGDIDVIFCRNVMIYFDVKVRQRLVSEIERLLKVGGLLCIGHSETLTGIDSNMKVIKPSIYMKY